MKPFHSLLIASLLAFVPLGMAQQIATVKAGQYTLSGPYAHDNLTIFLIHGADPLPGRDYVILDEAIAAGTAIVHETSNVNELAVENLSQTHDLYIPAGTIVKGGKQDRTIAQDLIVRPGSGRVSIDAFCVEQGRWRARGQERATAFNAAKQALAGKDLKLAARYHGDQGHVWQEVAVAQDKLAVSTEAEVRAAESQTSLQLTLENEAVVKAVDGYIQKLSPIVEQKEDVIGYAFAINGEVNSAEVFASNALFKKLWPTLLNSSAVEAIAEAAKPADGQVTADDIRACIDAAESAEPGKSQAANDRTESLTRDGEKAVLFETRDSSADGYVRRSYYAK